MGQGTDRGRRKDNDPLQSFDAGMEDADDDGDEGEEMEDPLEAQGEGDSWED
jgi:hypothetical protein